MQPSRRSFLTGGRLFGGPWPRFLHRLGRLVHGRVEELTTGRDQPEAAVLKPKREEDVHHARALCSEMGVVMGLYGTQAVASGSVLWIDPSELRSLQGNPQGGWQAGPGVTVGQLRELGVIPATAAGNDDLSVALWLATLQGPALQSMLGAEGGLESARVVLFDGQSDVLGRFGAATRREPLGLALRDIVSELFRYAQRPQLQPWRQARVWPARYRLDALWHEEPNLARLLAGSHGTLAWLEESCWLPIKEVESSDVAAAEADATAEVLGADEASVRVLAAWVDEQVKLSFDPQGVLVRLPGPTS